MALKIFVDFDGTITKRDVGNAFFTQFGGDICTSYVHAFKSEHISAKELFRKETAAIGFLDCLDAKQFLHEQEIDPSFEHFVAYCREHSLEFHVVSDGLDYYIDEIFRHNNINGVSFFANRFELGSLHEGRASVSISFPFDDAECTRCACCKRNIILRKSGDDDVIVYVGEGYSDRCPAQYADVVFAKDDLQKFCQVQNISYYLYSSFDDVVARLRSMKRLKPRREAVLKRRDAFMAE